MEECDRFTEDQIARGECPYAKYSRKPTKKIKHEYTDGKHYHYKCILESISKKERDIFLSPGISMKHIFNKKTKYTHPHNLENVIDNTLRKGNNAIVQTYSSEYNIPEKRAALMISHIKNMDLLDKKFPGEFEIIACRIKNKEELRYLNRKFKKGYEKNISTQFYLKKENPNNPVMGIEGVPENKKEMNKLLYGIEGILNSGFNFAKGKYELKK